VLHYCTQAPGLPRRPSQVRPRPEIPCSENQVRNERVRKMTELFEIAISSENRIKNLDLGLPRVLML
jgi:hypothetical protein